MKTSLAPQVAAALDQGRIAKCFAALKAKQQTGFITFITAGDPSLDVTEEILKGLPKLGVDLIELGMPFSDPMADGPSIQAANIRAFKAGVTVSKTLQLVRTFRKIDQVTPLVLMGYYNPLYTYGVEKFLKDAKEAGVDGLIIVDLPPEEDEEMCLPSLERGINFIRLITPTTDAKRLPVVLSNASGFLYYVSVAGITGGKTANIDHVSSAIKTLRLSTQLPVAVGFGISTPEQVKAIAEKADAVVVGSAIVNRIASQLDAGGKPKPGLLKDVLDFVEGLAKAAHNR